MPTKSSCLVRSHSIAGLAIAATLVAVTTSSGEDWPRWRGPDGTGKAPNASVPATFSPETNVRWAVDVPGRGHASPIVVGDRIFLATAVDTEVTPDAAADAAAAAELEGGDAYVALGALGPAAGSSEPSEAATRQDAGGRGGNAQGRNEGRNGPGQEGRGPGRRGGGRGRAPAPSTLHDFVVLALDRADGSTVWQTTVASLVPHEGAHPTGTMAGATPVSDGTHVWAFFGSRGVYCLDAQDGTLVWGNDLGDMTIRGTFGEGASVAVRDGVVVVPWDHEGDSFVVGLDALTGQEKWRQPRDEPTAWTTPVFVEVGGAVQAIVAGTNATVAYDLNTGDERWRCGGMTLNVVPTPIVAHDMVYLISGFRGAALQAVKYAEAKGDITGSEVIAWSLDRGTPYVPSPALSGTNLYFLRGNNAILTCVDALTGVEQYVGERLDAGNVYASPVVAGGKVYICDREGVVIVLADGPELQVLARNEMGDGIDATPAIVGKEMFLRTTSRLYCITESGS